MYDTFDNAGNYGEEEPRARAEAEAALVEFHERPGPPDEVLRDVAHDESAYLTIVGAHEHHSFGGILIGHMIDHLLHEAPGPLALLTHEYLESAASA